MDKPASSSAITANRINNVSPTLLVISQLPILVEKASNPGRWASVAWRDSWRRFQVDSTTANVERYPRARFPVKLGQADTAIDRNLAAKVKRTKQEPSTSLGTMALKRCVLLIWVHIGSRGEGDGVEGEYIDPDWRCASRGEFLRATNRD
ncbi:hypothetical protein BDV96DRAFT_337087 [Lophiotrema nucula]|uniref:Uncharacterized protein n=1 Tax=Lophiotrema nucula TaxID=690887 RepID=A0A6A5YFX4_9PLEO|nr:hypothetical protein BDV96DRAFT_337087 [Lophiotrema nucula]